MCVCILFLGVLGKAEAGPHSYSGPNTENKSGSQDLEIRSVQPLSRRSRCVCICDPTSEIAGLKLHNPLQPHDAWQRSRVKPVRTCLPRLTTIALRLVDKGEGRPSRGEHHFPNPKSQK